MFVEWYISCSNNKVVPRSCAGKVFSAIAATRLLTLINTACTDKSRTPTHTASTDKASTNEASTDKASAYPDKSSAATPKSSSRVTQQLSAQLLCATIRTLSYLYMPPRSAKRPPLNRVHSPNGPITCTDPPIGMSRSCSVKLGSGCCLQQEQ
jgi:hypothetical protein